jgi:hypothetical protein
MMKNKKLIYGIIITFVLIVSTVLIWNNYQIQENSIKPIKLPSIISEECGIEQCHGLDITCGPNVPDLCTMMYVAGDSCRQFVNCQNIDGQCTLEKSSRFDMCKNCVEECELNFSDDPVNFFDCESRCAE